MARKYDRVFHLSEVILESASGRHQARISDLSPGGCFIDTIADIPVGDPVSFVIERADGPVHIEGRVRYHLTGIGLGIEFENAPPVIEQIIRDAATA